MSNDPYMARTLRENIDRLKQRADRAARDAPLGDRLAEAITRFAGSMAFVALHALLFGGWIVWNLGWLPGLEPFDPSFVMLAMEASVEAIFLSTFVLISQNRMAAAADRRGDLRIGEGVGDPVDAGAGAEVRGGRVTGVDGEQFALDVRGEVWLLYTSPSPRD